MNIQQLRHSLKVKWLLYYRQNRPWLTKLRIWGTYEGQRRPSSSFILATLFNLEPQLVQMLPFIVALSNNPDQILVALGLNFNPEEELKSLTEATSVVGTSTNGNVPASPVPPVVKTNTNGNGSLARPAIKTNTNGSVLTRPAIATISNGNGSSSEQIPTNKSEVVRPSPVSQASNLPSWVDESCKGVGWNQNNVSGVERENV